jgi:hypothetical protein
MEERESEPGICRTSNLKVVSHQENIFNAIAGHAMEKVVKDPRI